MDVAHDNPGRFISRDISKGEHAETSLDNLIERRHNTRVASEGERPEEEAWQITERQHDEQRRMRARYEWHLHHTAHAERLRRTLENLIARHEARAAALLGNLED